MKKKVLSIVLATVLMFSTSSIALAEGNVNSEKEEGDTSEEKTTIDGFRDFKWGTSKDEILSATVTDDMVEGEDYGFIGDGNTLVLINGDVAGYDSFIYYEFNDDSELVKGQYVITEEHTNLNDYYNDYLNIVLKYEKKYGKAENYDANWDDNTYKGKEDKVGMALAVGDLSIVTRWIDDDGSFIMAIISGDNYEINTSITYCSAEYEEKENTDGI